ncbi:hypothetical protein [Wolbachia endosymbiont of Cylisticus convexus]|nr:hypothetical protein [Wolbachia endosymbiont of Cylisticus convexus]
MKDKIGWIPVSRTGMTGKKGTWITIFFVLLHSMFVQLCVKQWNLLRKM